MPVVELKGGSQCVCQWFPVVGFRTPGESIRVNFCGAKNTPFVFDIEQVVLRQKHQIISHIKRQDLLQQQLISGSHYENGYELDVKNILLNHLISQGYAETCEAFYQNAYEMASYEKISNANAYVLTCDRHKEIIQRYPSKHELTSQLLQVEQRKHITDAVKFGKIQEAFELLERDYEGMLKQNRYLFFRLHSLNFVEQLRRYYNNSNEKNEQKDPKELQMLRILEYGRFLSEEFSGDSPEYQCLLNVMMGDSLAYLLATIFNSGICRLY